MPNNTPQLITPAMIRAEMEENQRFRSRGTQEQRRTATINQLLTSTIDCLAEYGYYNVTIQAVATRARLSQGAIFRHFVSREDLIIATAKRLKSNFVQLFMIKADEISQTQKADITKSLKTYLELISEIFTSREYLGWNELVQAARTDKALKSAMSEYDDEIEETKLKYVEALQGKSNESFLAQIKKVDVISAGVFERSLLSQHAMSRYDFEERVSKFI